MSGLSPAAQRRWVVVLTAVVVAPFVVAVVHQLQVGDRYLPIGDWSLLEMRVRDVGQQWLTTGVYSRYGWYHPGPLVFYVLAVPYRLLGGHSVDVNIGAVLVGAASVVGSALVAWRRGQLPVVVAVLAPAAVLIHAFGADQVQDPWNPYVSILPFFLFVLLAWSVAVGDAWLAVPMVVVASFDVQTHLAYLVPCVPVLAVAVLGCVVPRWRSRFERRRLAVIGSVCVGVALVLWFPVLWGTFVVPDGNVDAIRDFTASGRPTAGVGTAIHTMGLQWGLRPEWIVGPRPGFLTIVTEPTERRWWLAPGLAVLAAGGVIGWRRRDTRLAWLVALTGVATVAGALGVSRIVGPVVWYLVRWTWAVGALFGVVAVLAVLTWIARSRRATAGVLVAGGVIAVLASLGSSVAAADARTPFEPAQGQVRPVVARLVAALHGLHRPVVLDVGEHGSADYDLGLQLERRGIDVTVLPRFPSRFGTERSGKFPRDAARVVIVGPFNNPHAPVGGRRVAVRTHVDGAGRRVRDYSVYVVMP